jgi:hypothetical protein
LSIIATQSDISIIIGSRNSCIKRCYNYGTQLLFGKSELSSIISSSGSYIQFSRTSTIIGSEDSRMYNVGPSYNRRASIISSKEIKLKDTRNVSVISSGTGSVFSSCCSSMIASDNSYLWCSHTTLLSGSYNRINCCTYNSSIIGGKFNCLCAKFSTGNSMLGGENSCILGTSSLSSIIGGYCNLINSASQSSIIGGATNSICNSINSAIIGGFGLTLSSEDNVVYIPTLKLNLATQSIDSSKVLTWDGDNYVRYVDTSTLAGKSQPIDYQEVAWGTGTGITSSDIFKFYCDSANLLISTGSCVSSDSLRSTVIGGWTLSITASNDSLILGGIMQTMATSSYSSILGGSCNCIDNSYSSGIMSSSKGVIIGSSNGCSIYNTIISSCRVCICSCGAQEPKYSSIISSVNVTIDNQSFNNSVISSAGNAKITKTSLSTLLASTGGCICNSIRAAFISGCGNCNNITYGVSIISSESSQIISNSAAGANLTRRICYSSIIGGGYNCICNFTRNSIITSGCKNIVWGKETYVSGTTFSTPGMSIIGSRNSTIYNSDYSSIISSTVSGITGSYTSTIIGSVISKITGSTVSSIISSSQSLIENSERSSIIGGYGMTLSSENDVVYLSSLKIDTVTVSTGTTKILTWDNDKYVRWTTPSSGILSLPVPKINLNNYNPITTNNYADLDVYDAASNTVHATQSRLYNFPTLVNLDFTSDHFINPNNRIFIEMAYYRRKSQGKAKWSVPSKHIANVGLDVSLPWNISASQSFWTRGGSHYQTDGTLNPPLLGVNRINHYEVLSYTHSSYNIWEYLHNRFTYFTVNYRDASTFNPADPMNSNGLIQTLVPAMQRNKLGQSKASRRYAYDAAYTPLYCTFRYIYWIPSANNGKGQIISGPFSKILKITGYFFPFDLDYVKSAQYGWPVANLNQQWLNGRVQPGPNLPPGYNLLKCNFESNLP